MLHRSTAPVSGQEFRRIRLSDFVLPAWVQTRLQERGVCTTARNLLAVVHTFSIGKRPRGCYARNRTLAAQIGDEGRPLSTRSVTRAVAELVAAGLVTVRGIREERTLWSTWCRAMATPPLDTGCPDPLDTACLDISEEREEQSTPPHPKPARVGRTCPTPDASGPLPRAKEESSVLIPMGTPAVTKATPADSDYAAAGQLHRIITTHAKMAVPYSRRGWADHIRKLRNDLGGDAARVQRALDFLAKHYGDQYCPKPTCAAKLREKFPAIEAAIARQPAPLVLTPQAQDITRRLQKEYTWRGGEPGLGAAVQRSVDAFLKFQDELTAHAKTDSRTARLAKKLLVGDFGSLKAGMREWFDWANGRIQRWGDWAGRWDFFLWSPMHERVSKTGRSAAEERSGDGSGWDRLLEELGYGG